MNPGLMDIDERCGGEALTLRSLRIVKRMKQGCSCWRLYSAEGRCLSLIVLAGKRADLLTLCQEHCLSPAQGEYILNGGEQFISFMVGYIMGYLQGLVRVGTHCQVLCSLWMHVFTRLLSFAGTDLGFFLGASVMSLRNHDSNTNPQPFGMMNAAAMPLLSFHTPLLTYLQSF